jgi:hypothetical protein
MSRDAANVIGAFVNPTALLAAVFGFWRLGVDLGWTGDFVIEQGLFSHWLVWIALAVGIKSSEGWLNKSAARRYAVPRRRR